MKRASKPLRTYTEQGKCVLECGMWEEASNRTSTEQGKCVLD